MDVAGFLDRIRQQPQYDGQLVHLERLPAREGRFADPSPALPAELARLIESRDIHRLYTHQVAALEAARAGRDVVIVTGTASGKTLCYNLPILERCLQDPDARALYLYPTKALAQDQLRGMLGLLSAGEQSTQAITPGVYDGDTPRAQRQRIRHESRMVLSNPDMLHAAILPYHPKWAGLFSSLRYIVLDEVHQYRGILGANVACVLRRLLRICEHYGSRPRFLCTSATIANPGELVTRLIGRDPVVVDDDGAPRGEKIFALWNPRPLGNDRLARRSAADDATHLMVEALEADAQVLAFARTRQAAELIGRYAREQLQHRSSPLHRAVRAYRGGYLPNERRAIEQALFSGRLRAVAATNALELGLDIGSLDVVLMVGYPGTIASTWQQAGRSGRRQDASLAVLLASNDPLDQFMLRHPDYFFAQSPENAVVDPENPYVLTNHLKAAAFELPLEDDDADKFGPLTTPIAGMLSEAGTLSEAAGRYYSTQRENPARGFSLRHMSDNTFSIVQRRQQHQRGGEPPPVGYAAEEDIHQTHEVIANVDAISAPELVYPEAVYLHAAQTYLVRRLDLVGKVAYVQRRETDYYTQAVVDSSVKIRAERKTGESVSAALLAYGDVDVTWQTVAFKKIKFATRENIGQGPVDIPAQSLSTTAMWIAPDDHLRVTLKQRGLRMSEALLGLRNLATVALPLVAMCDRSDLGGVVDSQNLRRATLILYDRYPGGLGYCELGFNHCHALLGLCLDMVQQCDCEEGCPSCVGLASRQPSMHRDPDLNGSVPIPNKQATLALLEGLLSSSTIPLEASCVAPTQACE
jgi:DEAD/DEAH box helicase domain-containing protein